MPFHSADSATTLIHSCKNGLQITVSSGGMLVQKLNIADLQFEKGQFDGTMAYAQNKVRTLSVYDFKIKVLRRMYGYVFVFQYCNLKHSTSF